MYLTLCAFFCIYLFYYICKKEFFSKHETMKNNTESNVKYTIEELSKAYNVSICGVKDALKTNRFTIIKMYKVIATHSLFKMFHQVYNFETNVISDLKLEIQRPIFKNGKYKMLSVEKNVKPEIDEEQIKLEQMGISTVEQNASYFHF